MLTLLVVLVSALLFLLLLLSIPLTLCFSLKWPETPESRINVRCLFGLLSFRLPVHRKLRNKKKDNANGKIQAKSVEAELHPEEKKSSTYNGFGYRRDLFVAVLLAARRCWQFISKDDVSVRLRFGLDDPADTGNVYGSICTLAPMLSRPGQISFELLPDFSDEIIELHSQGGLRFVPLTLIVVFLGTFVRSIVSRWVQ